MKIGAAVFRPLTFCVLIALLLAEAAPESFIRKAFGQANWKERWAETLEAARKEAMVVIDGAPEEDGLYEAFQRRYPNIKMNYRAGYGGGGQRVERIMTERRSGKYIPDLYTGGGRQIREVLHRGKIIDPIKPLLILPEVLDESKWWRGRHVYLDDEGEYILSFNGITQSYFHYNTKLVHPKDFKSYWDILDPKWAGKIVAWEPTASGVDGVLRFLYHTPGIGPQFLRRLLTEMNVTFTRDKRQFLDWLGTGKFAIAAFQSADRVGVAQAKDQGLPVDWFDPKTFKEGVPLSTSSGNIGLMSRSPHPNAARVYVNWLLSREGQTVYQKVMRDNDSLRTDIPKDDVPAHVRRLNGVNYALLTDPVYLDWEPVLRLVNEVWKKRK